MKFDAYAKIILEYIEKHDGETLLIKDIAADTLISVKTVQKKIAALVEEGYITKDGKRFFVS